jgi:hypothetical protein
LIESLSSDPEGLNVRVRGILRHLIQTLGRILEVL